MNAAKNQCESFKFVITSDNSFITALERLIAIEKMDNVEDYSLLECIAPLQEEALPTINAGQSTVLHIGHEEEGIGRS